MPHLPFVDLHEVDAPSLAPAGLYLLVVTVLVLGVRRCPWWMHVGAVAVGLPVRVWQDGWLDPAMSVVAALVLGTLGVLVTSRLLSGVSLFTLITSLALLPPAGLWVLLVGLAIAAAVGTWRTVRVFGVDRVQALAVGTASALGVTPGAFARPDLDLLHRREQEDVDPETSRRVRMFLPPHLLAGVGLSVALLTLSA